MWTRPDGWVYAGSIAAAFLLFNIGLPGERSRIKLLVTFVLAGLMAVAMYAPWLIWAWSYYGSPIPHTVIAKGLNVPMTPLRLAQRTVNFLLEASYVGPCSIPPFAPIYFDHGGWNPAVTYYCGFLGWIGLWYWVLPFGNRETRALSLAYLLGNWYLNVVAPYPANWYFPNVAILAVCIIGQIVQQGADGLGLLRTGLKNDRAFSQIQWTYRGFVVALPTFTMLVLLASAVQMRIQQYEIEDGNRRQIGLWLREHATSPKDTVFLEPLGYIGYFSQLKMFDYPGLSSPEVVAARRKAGSDSYRGLIAELDPDWLVLRPSQVNEIILHNGRAQLEKYKIVKIFDASKRLDDYCFIPGSGYVRGDQKFIVCKRRRD